jgi:hypothetical protein
LKKLFWAFKFKSSPLNFHWTTPKIRRTRWSMTDDSPKRLCWNKKVCILRRLFGSPIWRHFHHEHFLYSFSKNNLHFNFLSKFGKFTRKLHEISKPKCAYWSTKLKICKWIECLALVIASLLSAEDNDNDDMRRILFCVLKSRWIEALIVKVFWCRNGRDWR